MKILLLAFFVAVAAAAPTPDDVGEPVEVIVNGVADGEALEIGHIVDITLKEHVDGEVAAATNLLHPYTAQGMAEAIAAAEAVEGPQTNNPELEVVVPEPIMMPEAGAPVIVNPVPEPIVMPEAGTPEVEIAVPEPIVMPEPGTPEVEIPVPAPIVMPEPGAPEIDVPVVQPIAVPEPVPEIQQPVPEPIVEAELDAPQADMSQIPSGEIYNDGLVQVHVNVPEETGIIATLQSWLSIMINYVTGGVQTTHQII